jgi:hypothetical protein
MNQSHRVEDSEAERREDQERSDEAMLGTFIPKLLALSLPGRSIESVSSVLVIKGTQRPLFPEHPGHHDETGAQA